MESTYVGPMRNGQGHTLFQGVAHVDKASLFFDSAHRTVISRPKKETMKVESPHHHHYQANPPLAATPHGTRFLI